MKTSHGFQNLDPTSTYIYKGHTVVYAFETESYCFLCDVRSGYLTGRRCHLPDEFMWAIGQHIDTLKDFVVQIRPLRIK